MIQTEMWYKLQGKLHPLCYTEVEEMAHLSPATRNPLGNLEANFSAQSHTFTQRVSKNDSGSWNKIKTVYGACWDVSKETFSGTNKMFLLGKGLCRPSKSPLKWNDNQSPVTHTWVKRDAPLEKPLSFAGEWGIFHFRALAYGPGK